MPPPEHPRTPEVRVLFVCLGNICRSPLAEGVFRHLAESRGLGDSFVVDSAGTGGWHAGESPDARSVRTAERRGIRIEGAARKVREADFASFDLIVAMDRSNLRDLETLAARADGHATLRLLREFDHARDAVAAGLDVPDPYYGGPEGFEVVFDIVFRSCSALLDHLRDAAGA